MDGTTVTKATDFKYFGSTVQEDEGSEKEVKKRIRAGWNSWRKVTGVLCCVSNQETGKTDGSSRDENAKVLPGSDKKGQTQK